MASRYIHTIEDHMGYFVPDAFAPGHGQICYAHHGVPVSSLIVPDYETLRRQRAETVRSRQKFCNNSQLGTYGYIRVKV